RVRRGDLDPEQITAGTLARHLGTNGIPDPDLLIRTSGEMRLSNFFLWQLAYTEMYVTDTLWPDFRERDYLQALAFFQQRQRRFGRTSAQVEREKLRAAKALLEYFAMALPGDAVERTAGVLWGLVIAGGVASRQSDLWGAGLALAVIGGLMFPLLHADDLPNAMHRLGLSLLGVLYVGF